MKLKKKIAKKKMCVNYLIYCSGVIIHPCHELHDPTKRFNPAQNV